MKVLVLGGNGFIGSHVVDELLLGGFEIRVFSRNVDKWRNSNPNVEYVLGDFADSDKLAESLQGVDIVLHMISSTVPSTSNLDPIQDIKDNLENSVRLFQLMVSFDIKRIIYLSSGGTVYGKPNILPIPESHELNPLCSYGVVKLSVEKYLGMFKKLYGLKPLILRPSNPYGPRQSFSGAQGVISTFMHQILNEQKIQIWGDGSIRRDYIYITDFAKLCRKGVESNIQGIFNAGSGKSLSVIEIIKYLEGVIGKKAKVVFLKARNFDVQEITLDITKVQEEFCWKPLINIKEGIIYQFKWMSK